mmetsp:Transcript_33129/g.91308  ORF Transcript_33129/g.91308 Transcript_33129/m.91308 type:complete len:206 (-) Transcript_33129:1568-2185(-)
MTLFSCLGRGTSGFRGAHELFGLPKFLNTHMSASMPPLVEERAVKEPRRRTGRRSPGRPLCGQHGGTGCNREEPSTSGSCDAPALGGQSAPPRPCCGCSARSGNEPTARSALTLRRRSVSLCPGIGASGKLGNTERGISGSGAFEIDALGGLRWSSNARSRHSRAMTSSCTSTSLLRMNSSRLRPVSWSSAHKLRLSVWACINSS